jgi:uncharacterized MAPEG superfamily protein
MTLVASLLVNLIFLGALLGLQVLFRTTNHGVGYALSNLDKNNPKSILEDRLLRVKNNQLEFLVLVAPLILLVLPGQIALNHAPEIALAFVIGRAVYVLVTLAGIPFLRSASWLVGFFAWAYLLIQVSMNAFS